MDTIIIIIPEAQSL